MQTFCKARKLTVYISLILAFGVLTVSCSTSLVNADSGDCGYSAFYDTKEHNGKIEIVFSMIMAEVLNGHKNCGFGFLRTKVDRAEIDGVALPERQEKDVHFYAAPTGFDPRKHVISIHVGKDRYVSDPTSVKQTDTNFNIFLKPAK